MALDTASEAVALSASQRNSMRSLACFSPLTHFPLGLSIWLLPCHSPEGNQGESLSPVHRKVVLYFWKHSEISKVRGPCWLLQTQNLSPEHFHLDGNLW